VGKDVMKGIKLIITRVVMLYLRQIGNSSDIAV